MTRLLRPAPEIAVRVGPAGAPDRLDGLLRGRLEPLTSWTVEQDWWEQPVRRHYWKLLLEGRVLLEVFHDLITDAWFLERLYD